MKWKKSSARLAKNSRNSKQNAARSRPNGSSARKSASPISKRIFDATQKRLEGEIARLAADIKDRTLRAQIEKQSGRRMGKIAGPMRAPKPTQPLLKRSPHRKPTSVFSRNAPAKPVAPERLSAGQRVVVKGFKQPLIFRRHDGRTAEVEAGPMRMKVPLGGYRRNRERSPRPRKASQATPRAPAESPCTRSRATSLPPKKSTSSARTVEEATRRVDKFIDEAALAGKSAVRIIHGHGTGALRRGLAEFLTSHPLVERIRAEAEDRGGTAITVAELRAKCLYFNHRTSRLAVVSSSILLES